MDHNWQCCLHALRFVFRCQLLWHPPCAVFWTTGAPWWFYTTGNLREMTSCTANDAFRSTLCIQNLYHRPHFTVGGSWNKSLLQPLQRCYCENWGSPATAHRSGGCWDIYMGVQWIRENLTKGIVSNQDYQNLSFHELVKWRLNL